MASESCLLRHCPSLQRDDQPDEALTYVCMTLALAGRQCQATVQKRRKPSRLRFLQPRIPDLHDLVRCDYGYALTSALQGLQPETLLRVGRSKVP